MLHLDKPRDRDTHTIADFVELLCLATEDRVCSRETVADHVKDVGDSRLSDVELDDCFMHFAWRAQAFGPRYPFQIDAGRRTIRSSEILSGPQRSYAFLLYCANLPFLERPYTPLTDAFERIAFSSLQAMWPPSAVVKPFGKNETEYVGAKWERINQLATQIGALPHARPESFRAGDSGDGGIDLAAWLPLDEFEGRNLPSALAQCACSREQWSAKQTEISITRLGSVIPPTHHWMQIIFIPLCFRAGDGSWAFEGDVGQTIVMDRLRILSRLDDAFDVSSIEPPPLFDALLALRLEPV